MKSKRVLRSRKGMERAQIILAVLVVVVFVAFILLGFRFLGLLKTSLEQTAAAGTQTAVVYKFLSLPCITADFQPRLLRDIDVGAGQEAAFMSTKNLDKFVFDARKIEALPTLSDGRRDLPEATCGTLGKPGLVDFLFHLSVPGPAGSTRDYYFASDNMFKIAATADDTMKRRLLNRVDPNAQGYSDGKATPYDGPSPFNAYALFDLLRFYNFVRNQAVDVYLNGNIYPAQLEWTAFIKL